MKLPKYAAWGGWQAGGGRRGPALVRPETLKKLHTKVIPVPAYAAPPGTPPTGYYCLGWDIAKMPFAPDPFLTHAGSNNMNLATIFLMPEQDYGMVIATNVSGTKADDALKGAAAELYDGFGPK